MKNLVAPHLLPQIDLSKQAQLEAVVAEAVSKQMRAVLHHPHFQAVEAAWRAVEFLVRRLDTGPQLQIYLLDLSKAELAADLRAGDDLGATGIYRLFVEQSVGTPGGQPWGILAGLYAFDHGREDVESLVRLALIAKRAGAPFLAEGSPRILGCSSLAETPRPEDWKQVGEEAKQTWEALRQVPEAAYVGLALPRLLLRLPYGKDATPVESFPFEEMPTGVPHEGYLWGNPAIGCVYLLAEAFSREGWDLTSDLGQEIAELPLHVYREAGSSCIKPCAEALLGERAVDAILTKGLMPLLSIRDQDAVRLARFQSVANPATRLAGRWKE